MSVASITAHPAGSLSTRLPDHDHSGAIGLRPPALTGGVQVASCTQVAKPSSGRTRQEFALGRCLPCGRSLGRALGPKGPSLPNLVAILCGHHLVYCKLTRDWCRLTKWLSGSAGCRRAPESRPARDQAGRSSAGWQQVSVSDKQTLAQPPIYDMGAGQ